MWQNTSGSTIYKELVVFLPFSLENAIHRCYFSLDASLTNWQRRETEKKSLRIIPLTMFWSAWMRFTFERPSWRCQSSSAPSFLHDCIKSVSFAQFIFLRFISSNMSLCNLMANKMDCLLCIKATSSWHRHVRFHSRSSSTSPRSNVLSCIP